MRCVRDWPRGWSVRRSISPWVAASASSRCLIRAFEFSHWLAVFGFLSQELTLQRGYN